MVFCTWSGFLVWFLLLSLISRVPQDSEEKKKIKFLLKIRDSRFHFFDFRFSQSVKICSKGHWFHVEFLREKGYYGHYNIGPSTLSTFCMKLRDLYRRYETYCIRHELNSEHWTAFRANKMFSALFAELKPYPTIWPKVWQKKLKDFSAFFYENLHGSGSFGAWSRGTKNQLYCYFFCRSVGIFFLC